MAFSTFTQNLLSPLLQALPSSASRASSCFLNRWNKSSTRQLLTEWRKWWGKWLQCYLELEKIKLSSFPSSSHCVFWGFQLLVSRGIFQLPKNFKLIWVSLEEDRLLPFWPTSNLHHLSRTGSLWIQRMLPVVCYLPQRDMSQFFFSFFTMNLTGCLFSRRNSK